MVLGTEKQGCSEFEGSVRSGRADPGDGHEEGGSFLLKYQKPKSQMAVGHGEIRGLHRRM